MQMHESAIFKKIKRLDVARLFTKSNRTGTALKVRKKNIEENQKNRNPIMVEINKDQYREDIKKDLYEKNGIINIHLQTYGFKRVRGIKNKCWVDVNTNIYYTRKEAIKKLTDSGKMIMDKEIDDIINERKNAEKEMLILRDKNKTEALSKVEEFSFDVSIAMIELKEGITVPVSRVIYEILEPNEQPIFVDLVRRIYGDSPRNDPEKKMNFSLDLEMICFWALNWIRAHNSLKNMDTMAYQGYFSLASKVIKEMKLTRGARLPVVIQTSRASSSDDANKNVSKDMQDIDVLLKKCKDITSKEKDRVRK